jgi:hypothetical protein
LTVTDATLVSIEVTPAAPSITLGSTQQFTATGSYSDGSTQDLTTQVTWASSDSAVATVSNAAGSNGLGTSAGVGSTTVSATSDAVTGSTTLTVTAATLDSIEVTPAAPSVSNGATQQFTATGHYSDGSTQDLTAEVTWASSDNAVATVSNAAGSNGLATGVGFGTATISATDGVVSGSATLSVTGVSASVNQQVAALLVAVTGVGPGNSLATTVTAVQNFLAVPDIASACSALGDFIVTVTSQSGKKISTTLADQFLADADAISTAIPCP